MAFKLKGFPEHKGVSASPMTQTKFTHSWDGIDESKNKLQRGSTSLTENKGFGGDATSLIQKDREANEVVKDATDGQGTTEEQKENLAGTIKTETPTSDKYNQDGTLKEGDKKWHEKQAFKESGIGHIVDAFKSIRKGVKNIKAKRKTKKAEKLDSAKTAVGSGTETLKQAKLVERNRKKTDKKAKSDIKKAKKDKLKLAKYRKKNPVRGKEAINLLANQTKKDKKLKDRYGTGADAAKKAGKTGDEPTGLKA